MCPSREAGCLPYSRTRLCQIQNRVWGSSGWLVEMSSPPVNLLCCSPIKLKVICSQRWVAVVCSANTHLALTQHIQPQHQSRPKHPPCHLCTVAVVLRTCYLQSCCESHTEWREGLRIHAATPSVVMHTYNCINSTNDVFETANVLGNVPLKRLLAICTPRQGTSKEQGSRRAKRCCTFRATPHCCFC